MGSYIDGMSQYKTGRKDNITKLYKQLGNLRNSIPIDEKYYLLSQIKIDDVKAFDILQVFAEYQAVSKGLKKGDYAIYETSIIKTSRVKDAVFSKGDNEYERTICLNIGDNIINKKDHYQQVCRAGAIQFDKSYGILYVNLWVKSGSTQASSGDKCYFKENTSLIGIRNDN